MAAKPDRYKKLPALKGKKVSPMGKGGGKREAKLTADEIEEGNVASELLQKRSTSEFSTTELSALMQIPPGGAEPHQIKTKSRQFNRVANDMPEATVNDRTVGIAGDSKRRPMSAKTPKIDLND